VNPSIYLQSVTLTATVPSDATGTVTFNDGATTLSTVTISAGTAPTYTTSALTTSTHSITAVYSGDANYNTATSSTLTQTVNKATPTVTLTSTANPSTLNESLTLKATVPLGVTGTVTFKDGTTTVGMATIVGTMATYATTSLTLGTHSITAVYSGDTNYNTVASSALSQTIGDFAVAVGPATQVGSAGGTLTYTVQVTSVSGGATFGNTVTLATIGMPGIQSSFTPASVTPGQTSAMTITISPQIAGLTQKPSPFPGKATMVLAVLLPLGMVSIRKHRGTVLARIGGLWWWRQSEFHCQEIHNNG
jgi:hypothetical protein